MLDKETKNRIDTARDILVGKVPNPQSQVEQITIALIYKFMNDMDNESKEMGGKATFFSGKYEKYKWENIFDPKLGGVEVLNLYSEAITNLNLNPNIPQLFRDIFKNAYLPYRDPETLKLFLKTINEFHYDHSEKLGDAFEYLLSVLGSQGDAGMFRTPRHIIDFIVSVVEPKKNDTICDPACGTAGFLISAFKYILETNTKKTKGDLLTPDDKKNLMENIVGLDISPDMVRLSLVNMYLHNFTVPKIYEYDTLTSEERWNDYFDVILANPPFMSPKGGIKPHKKFSLQVNRSEVLFVDYIAEHINPINGRAGVIVPEGVIFQSGSAYKQLRKSLVEDKYLYAVVSLPAGVFQPYAGVKTSILFMDKAIAKKSNEILFVKIENDGFDLGAQRSPIEKNDLPESINYIKKYKDCVLKNSKFTNTNKNVFLVEKSKLALGNDYNLTIDRYREIEDLNQSDWEMVKLQDVCEFITDGTHQTPKYESKGVVFLSSRNVTDRKIDWEDVKYISEELHNEFSKRMQPRVNDILLAKNGTTGVAAIVDREIVFDIYVSLAILRPAKNIIPKFLLYNINCPYVKKQFNSRLQGIGVPNLHLKEIREVKIPLPSLSIQKEIVKKIENYQKIIDGAKQIVENYKPQIDIDINWKIMELGESKIQIIDGDRGKNYPKSEDFTEEGYCLFLNTGNVRKNGFKFKKLSFISKEKDAKLSKGKLNRCDIVLTTRGTVGNLGLYNDSVPFQNIRINSGMVILRPDNKEYISSYIYYLFQTEYIQKRIKEIISGAAQPQLPIRSLSKIAIPTPSVEMQKNIVLQLEEEKELINSSKKLIKIYEDKIKNEIDKLWQK